MSPIVREVTIGPCRLIQGDCMEVLPTLPKVDAVITDPPYGIGDRLTQGGKGQGCFGGMTQQASDWHIKPSSVVFEMLFAMSQNQMIWGGNFFALPPCDKPLCWDKIRPNQRNVSEWEYCWTSLCGRAEKFNYCANGGFVAREVREHPTQKPTPLIKWCLSFIQDAKTILDPFMGSGTTGVACIQTGRRFIGIEKEPKYFDIAVKRTQRAWDLKCSELPFEQVEPQKQTELFEEEVK